jgi:hypothetical protein
MTNLDSSVPLPGSVGVKEWFGEWPKFHDGEVVSLSLCRKGESVLLVYPYYPEKPATVEFILTDITDLELVDFSSQNVISDLRIEQITNERGDSVLRLVLDQCFGLAGFIEAKKVRVNLLPGKSTDGVSLW